MNKVIARTLLLLFLTATALRAQEPRLINYQGRVVVGGVNFDGSGQFKFAIIDAAGSTTYWSNDGTSAAGSEPSAAVTLTVIGSAYSVLLGDSALANMAAIPASALNKADLFVRVWFNDGRNGSQLLTPDQRLAAGHAGRVPNGGAMACDSWLQRNNNGTAPAGRKNNTALWTGSEMIVWGGNGVGDIAMNTGGRYNPAANSWTAVSTIGAPAARSHHTAVWTGSQMIVWGGANDSGVNLNTGGRYNPAGNSWTAVSTTGAPPGRRSHKAVWTGSEMIVWGGWNGPSYFDDTFSYTPGGGAFCIPSAFRITSAVLDSGNLTLSFPSVTGRTYTLWSSDTLAAGTWTNFGLPALTGTGATLTFTVPSTTPGRRFFRVQVDP